jgi:NUMOD4 motif/NUMOD1 domain
MKQREYPYQQSCLEDLPYERWDDIPFLDGLYRISNFGRIKRLDIVIVTKRGYTMELKSKILSPWLQKVKNKSINDYTHFLVSAICSEGVIYKFSISRLVYYCFVKKFALDNYFLVVMAKDGDGRNIMPSNLQLGSLEKKQQRIYQRGRFISNITTTFDEYSNEGKIKSKNPYTKQVSQYTPDGKLIQTFPSIRVAEKITAVTEAGIVSVLKKRQVSSGGYVWGYGIKKNIDVARIRKANLKHRNILVGRKVTQYNLKGIKIAYYNTLAEACRKTGVNTSDINAVLKSKQRSAGGFIWKEGIGAMKIDVEGLLTGEAWRAFRRQKEVKQYTIQGNFICSFQSVTAAAKYSNVAPSYISKAIKKKLVVKNSLWKFSKKIKNILKT